jgi:hypothetical protein
MAKKSKDKVELVYTKSDDVIEISDVVVAYSEPIDKNPLHTKYDKYIRQAKEGFLIGLKYPEAMEILRYCESKRKVQFGLNMGCPSCMLSLIRMFDSIRD